MHVPPNISRYIYMLVRMWQNNKMAIFHVEIYFSKSSLLYSWQVSLYTCQNNLFLVNATCLLTNAFFFFHVNLRAQFLYIKKTGDELGPDYGGVWEQTAGETTWRRAIRGRVFRKYLVYFQSMHRMPGCARWRPSWVIIETTRTVWRNITCRASTHNRLMHW